jgi:hypothetical protein
MRARLLFAVLSLGALACGPKPQPRDPDDDLDVHAAEAPAAPAAEPAARPIAPPARGARTGTIARDRLLAVLKAGPGMFLRQLEVTPRRTGDQVVGWQLVQLIDPDGPLHDVDVIPGDVLLSINGKPVIRPDQLWSVWESLRTANQVVAQMWRGNQQLELRFTIEPAVAQPAPTPAPASH